MLQFWLASLLIYLVLGLFWRVLFYIFYAPHSLPLTPVLQAFTLGARFDLTIACYFLTIPLIFEALVRLFRLQIKNNISFIWIFSGTILISIISMIELGFYGFFQDRLNTLMFGFFEDDTSALIATIWKNYPAVWIVLALILLQWIVFKGLQWLTTKPLQPISWLPWIIMFVLTCLGARGSVGLFPLGEMDTHLDKNPFINLLAYNPLHAFSRAVTNKSRSHSKWNSHLEAFGYGDNPAKAWADCFQLSADQVPKDPRSLLRKTTSIKPNFKKPHVVVLVMESMGAYWLHYQTEPFDLVGKLKPYLRSELATLQFLPSTSATIGSLSSLMAGVPHRPMSDFLTEGQDLGTKIRTAPALQFQRQGYHTRFIYAGNPGWRDIGKYARLQGFESVEGDTEIEKTLREALPRHDWGLFDEDIWRYLDQTMESAKTPEFVLVMTTANHPPYQLPPKQNPYPIEIPENIKQKMIGDPGVVAQRFQSFRNSNESLATFLNHSNSSQWGQQTVFGITGDHSFWVIHFDEQQLLDKNAVPFILKLPPQMKIKFPEGIVGSHDQIWPTLYNLVLSGATYDSLSTDMLDANTPSFAVNFSRLILYTTAGVLVGNSAKEDSPLIWKNGVLTPTTSTPLHQAMGTRYRCVMGVLDHLFYLERTHNDL